MTSDFKKLEAGDTAIMNLHILNIKCDSYAEDKDIRRAWGEWAVENMLKFKWDFDESHSEASFEGFKAAMRVRDSQVKTMTVSELALLLERNSVDCNGDQWLTYGVAKQLAQTIDKLGAIKVVEG